MKKTSDLNIYISSYDGYSDLWDVFFLIFNTFWPDCKYSIYLTNNLIEYKKNNVNVINTGIEINWFNRTIKSLELIDSEYILFLLEDYFISKRINNKEFDKIIDFMNINDIYFYKLSKSNYLKHKSGISKIPIDIRYPITLQPAIWKRKKLIKILKDINKDSPWDFEYYFDNDFKFEAKDDGFIRGIVYDNRDILGYKNGVLRGKWIPDTIKFYKKIGIDIPMGDRDILRNYTVFKYKLAMLLSKYLNKRILEIIKKTGISYFK